jgi:hypothetical protein
LPPETNIESAMSTYKNGMLEIVFGKKKQSEPKGKQINLEIFISVRVPTHLLCSSRDRANKMMTKWTQMKRLEPN